TPDGHVIIIDPEGIEMTPAGFPQRGAHLDGRMLGFWDIHNVPAIGVGDVRRMAQQLGSDMQYGLLMNQGEIRASQSVLHNSLVDASVTSSIIAPGAVLNDQLGDHAVTLPKLHEAIHVVENGVQYPLRYENTTPTPLSVGGSWVTVRSWTIPKQDDNHLMEICRLGFEVDFGTSTGYARSQVNGNVVQEFGPYEAQAGYFISIGTVIDFRGYPFGQNTFAIQLRRAQSSSVTMRIRNIRVYQNDQLPLRPGTPIYSVTQGGLTSGCYTHCQQTCQSSTQIGCPGCESNCQTSCERGCQATCESSSQGGGGCIREGTPITIWDPELQAYR